MSLPALYSAHLLKAVAGGGCSQLRSDFGRVATFVLGALAFLTVLGLLQNHPVILGVGLACVALWVSLLLASRVAGRAEEFRADAYAKEHGLGQGVISYLTSLDGLEGS